MSGAILAPVLVLQPLSNTHLIHFLWAKVNNSVICSCWVLAVTTDWSAEALGIWIQVAWLQSLPSRWLQTAQGQHSTELPLCKPHMERRDCAKAKEAHRELTKSHCCSAHQCALRAKIPGFQVLCSPSRLHLLSEAQRWWPWSHLLMTVALLRTGVRRLGWPPEATATVHLLPNSRLWLVFPTASLLPPSSS